MQLKHIFFAFLCLLTVAACHKHDDEGDTEAPLLTLEDPIEGSTVSGEVHVHGIVSDESLHEMDIKVTNDADGTVYLEVSPTVHDETEYHFDEHFTPTGLTGETAVTLTINVSDHSDHTTTKTVKFKVKP